MEAFARFQARVQKGSPLQDEQLTPSAPTPSTVISQRQNLRPIAIPAAATASTLRGYTATDSLLRQTAPKPSTLWPVRLKSPRYQIQVTVHHYLVAQVHKSESVTDLHAWAFVSTGLSLIAGGELVMVVQRRGSETPDSFPIDFLHICDTVQDRASSPSPSPAERFPLRRGMLITLDEPVFQRPDFRTIVLGLRNTPLLGSKERVQWNQSSPPHFYCLILSDGEVAAAKKGGVLRTLVGPSRDSDPWFPFPFYVDRDRTPTLTGASMDGSVVTGPSFSKLEVVGLNVIYAMAGQVTLHVPRERVAEFKAAMLRKWRAAPGGSMLIPAEMHDGCDGVFSWTRGAQAVVRTITDKSVTNIAANFLLLSFNQARESVSLVEDGLLGMSSFLFPIRAPQPASSIFTFFIP